MYDEDNIDLEEQMYLQDIQDELNEQYDDDIDETEEIPVYSYKLNKSFLLDQCKQKEFERKSIKFINKNTNAIFEGIVLGHSSTDDNKFVFNVCEIINKEKQQAKTRIFSIKDIEKVD